MNKERSTVKGIKLGVDCMIDYDSMNHIAILKLLPKDKLKLGTVRVGLSATIMNHGSFQKLK